MASPRVPEQGGVHALDADRPDLFTRVIHVTLALYLVPVLALVTAVGVVMIGVTAGVRLACRLGGALRLDRARRYAGLEAGGVARRPARAPLADRYVRGPVTARHGPLKD